MEDPELYDLSATLGGIVTQAKQLMGMQALRYKYFVDNSPLGLGFDCTYSKKTSMLFHTEEGVDSVRAQLLRMRKQIDRALEDTPTETSFPSWLIEYKMERGEL